MSVTELKVKKSATGPAPLKNIRTLDEIVERLMNRDLHLPGIASYTGPSGWGKSTAAAFVSARYQATYVEIRSTWTKKALLEALLKAMGITPAGTVSNMLDQVSEELGVSQRPLILDEFDYAVAKEGLVDLVRDIYEQSMAPIVIIGEEKLPMKLKRWERFDGRIMDWAQALPADIEDARVLNRHYTPGVTVEDDLLSVLVSMAGGSVRRIVTNLDRIANVARMEGTKSIGLSQWKDRPLHTGQAPKVRGF